MGTQPAETTGLGIKPSELSKTADFVEELYLHRTQTGQKGEQPMTLLKRADV